METDEEVAQDFLAALLDALPGSALDTAAQRWLSGWVSERLMPADDDDVMRQEAA